jgi:hypothetical protein
MSSSQWLKTRELFTILDLLEKNEDHVVRADLDK